MPQQHPRFAQDQRTTAATLRPNQSAQRQTEQLDLLVAAVAVSRRLISDLQPLQPWAKKAKAKIPQLP
jgi:hypothetical protein